MGRPPRQFTAGGVYHIYSRGSNRQAIFTFDSDRVDFLECLDRAVQIAEHSCLAYCLMSNHYHLVLESRDGLISRVIQSLNGRYSNRFNRRYDRDAHLFKNRFGATLQTSTSQLFWTLRYTVMNPVTSGLCGSPEEWRWSSYRASAGIDVPPPFLDVRRLWSYFADVPEAAMSAYCNAIEETVGV